VRVRRIVRLVLLATLGLLVLIQFVPYGRDHANPPVSAEPDWDSPETRALADGACFDCHSNETEWPWYTNIAPVSWLVQRDVEEGREALNFSEWDRAQEELEVAEAISEGAMPPWYFAALHSDARLSSQQEQRLIAGLRATFLRSPPLRGAGD
jgi:hypothetical protein